MKNTSKILIAFGAGIAIGGLLGVLFAPDKGSVTRHNLADGGKKFVDKLNRKVKLGKDRLREEFSKVNDELEEELV